jgi:hypothetical protein
MRVLVELQRRDFEARTVAYVHETLAELTDHLTDEEVGMTVASAIDQAIAYGLGSELDLVRYVNFAVLLGPDFETREEWGWIQAILTDSSIAPTDRMTVVFKRLEAAAENRPEATDD